MCYHTTLERFKLQSEDRFTPMQDDYKIIEEYDELYHINGFDFPAIPIVASDDPTRFQSFYWGLIPSWIKTEADANKIRLNTLNARSDTMFEKPSYKGASNAGRRCLIPATGIFEWQTVNKKKYPYFIHLKNGELFYIGGIWEEWIDRHTGETKKTFSMVTTNANPLMANIHNDGQRMPVILPTDLQMDWLNPELPAEEVLKITVPYNEDLMEAYTISKLITSRSENSNVPEITARFEYPELVQQLGLF